MVKYLVFTVIFKTIQRQRRVGIPRMERGGNRGGVLHGLFRLAITRVALIQFFLHNSLFFKVKHFFFFVHVKFSLYGSNAGSVNGSAGAHLERQVLACLPRSLFIWQEAFCVRCSYTIFLSTETLNANKGTSVLSGKDISLPLSYIVTAEIINIEYSTMEQDVHNELRNRNAGAFYLPSVFVENVSHTFSIMKGSYFTPYNINAAEAFSVQHAIQFFYLALGIDHFLDGSHGIFLEAATPATGLAAV